MKTNRITLIFIATLASVFIGFKSRGLQVSEAQFQLAVLKFKTDNPVLRIKISNSKAGQKLNNLSLSTKGVSDLRDIKAARLYYYAGDSMPGNMEDSKKAKLVSSIDQVKNKLEFKADQMLQEGDNYFWLSYELVDDADLLNFVD